MYFMALWCFTTRYFSVYALRTGIFISKPQCVSISVSLALIQFFYLIFYLYFPFATEPIISLIWFFSPFFPGSSLVSGIVFNCHDSLAPFIWNSSTAYAFFWGKFFIRVQLIYSIVSIYAVQPSDPVIHMHTFLFSYYLSSCSIPRNCI